MTEFGLAAGRWIFLPMLLGGSLTASPCSHAQVASSIVPDGTLGTTVSAGGDVFTISGGTIRGANQFHSFDRFSVGTGDLASFGGPAGIANILSRVTGGASSQVDGSIRSTISGANLFLMNPTGIMFGPNAQLDLSGSFHATTADYIGLADGTRFNALASPDGALLTAAAPSAFGFLDANPAPIDVQTGGVDADLGVLKLLSVPEGETLSLIGGDITLGTEEFSAAPGYVMAPGGKVEIASVASPGEVTWDTNGYVDTSRFSALGEVTVQGASVIDGKDVVIRGGKLTIDDGLILPGFLALFELATAPDGGEVNIETSESVIITGENLEPLSETAPGIATYAGSLFAPGTFEPAKVPDISIKTGSFSVSNFSAVQAFRFGPGESSTVSVEADAFLAENGGSIALFNVYEGSGGLLNIDAGEITLSGDGGPAEATGATGLLAQGLFHPCYGCDLGEGESDFDPGLTNGDSGSITVKAGTLTVEGDAVITTDSLNFGDGGSIEVAAGTIDIVGTGAETAGITAQSILVGEAGDVDVNASETIQFRGGGRVSVSTTGSGGGGAVSVSAGESIRFEGADSRVLSVTIPLGDEALNPVFEGLLGVDFDTLRLTLNDCCGVPVDADLFTVLEAMEALGFFVFEDELVPGDGGKITVTTPTLTMEADTLLESSTGWDGNAGEVEANVGTLSLRDGAEIRSTSGTELLSGEVIVGSGNAGNVSITADDQLAINGVSTESGTASAVSTSTLASGDGGSISLSAPLVLIENGGKVTADSEGSGLTGNISIVASNEIRMKDGSISTAARTSDGGNIELRAPKIIHLTDSTVSTSVESGVGGGGNILLDPKFVVLNKSDIIANAFGGPGGNITIVAENFIPSADSTVEASSQLGVQGTIVIESPENDLASQIAQLPSAYLATDDLLPERCAARRSGAESSFVIFGDGGLPTDPDGYLPSFGALGNVPAGAGGSAYLEPSNDEAYTQVRGMTLAFLDPGC